MKAVKTIIITLVVLFVLGVAGLFVAGYFSPKPGGIRIETDPKASVFVNGALVGETPYQGTYKAGKILLRLVPEGSSQNLIPFETTLTLSPGIETVVGRTFKTSEEDSSGYIISFERNSMKTTGLMVMSDPGNAQVLIDGVSRGFSPYTSTNIAPAMHTVEVKSPDYSDFSMTVKTMEGYRLTFFVKLGKGGESGQSLLISKLPPTKMVTILDTPTGYLRVRSKPGESGGEIAEVKPGEKYVYIDTDTETGWIEIQYEATKSGLPRGMTGWISGKYASVSGEVN